MQSYKLKRLSLDKNQMTAFFKADKSTVYMLRAIVLLYLLGTAIAFLYNAEYTGSLRPTVTGVGVGQVIAFLVLAYSFTIKKIK